MRTSPLSPADIERYRSLAKRLYEDQFDSNQSKFGRAWGIAQPTVGKILSGKANPSERAAMLLCKLAGEHYPLPSHTNGHVVGKSLTQPAPVRRAPANSDTLDKVLDLFGGKFGPATSEAARALKEQLRDLEPEEWISALGELSTVLKNWEKKYAQGPSIEDPGQVLGHK